jgi:hypothetical protein
MLNLLKLKQGIYFIMFINTYFALQQTNQNHTQQVRPLTITINKKLEEEFISNAQKYYPSLQSPYHEEYNFYSDPDKMGFSAETAVTNLAERFDRFNSRYINNFERHKEYSVKCDIEKLKNYIARTRRMPENDYRIAIAKTRNTLIYYLNMHGDPNNPVEFSTTTVKNIKKILKESVNPLGKPNEHHLAFRQAG